MINAGLVVFAMVVVVAGVGHVFQRGRSAPELIVSHGVALSAVFLVMLAPDRPVGAVFAGCASLLILSLARHPQGAWRAGVRVLGALTMAAALALDALVLIDVQAPRIVLAGLLQLTTAVAVVPALRAAAPGSQQLAAGVVLGLACMAGNWAALAPGHYLYLLIPAWALTTLLRVAPHRLPGLAEAATALLGGVVAASAALAAGGPALEVAGLAGAGILAFSGLSRLLVGNARVFSAPWAKSAARPAPDLPLGMLAPIRERDAAPAPVHGQASARSLLEDAVEGSFGRFRVDDRTFDSSDTSIQGDLPRIVDALRAALGGARSDKEPVTLITLRGSATKVAFELDHAVEAEIADRARGLLAAHGGQVFVSRAGDGTTQLVIPASPVRGDA